MSKKGVSRIRALCLMFSFILILTTVLVNPSTLSYAQQVSNDQPPVKLEVVEVTASEHDGNFPENTIDDDLSTRWSAQGEGQWIQFGLGSVQRVGYLGIAFHSGDIRSSTIAISVSTDGTTWEEVLGHSESSGTSVQLEAFDFDDVDARYVRITGYGNSVNQWNSLTVVHIYSPNPDGPIVEELEQIDPGPIPGTNPFTTPGLHNPDGTAHTIHTPNPVFGRTLNILDYGDFEVEGVQDAVLAIIAALEDAEYGDEIYFPNGVYQLISTWPTDGTSNIYVKNGVNLRGESEEGVQLISHFDMQQTPNSKIITSYGRHDVQISNLTLSSTFDREFSDVPDQNNPERGGPAYGIFIADYAGNPSYHVTIQDVTIEKFQRMGVRIEKSRDIVIENSTFKNATDVGGGGAGYGVAIQGVQGIDRLGHKNDTHFNVVRNSTFEGPYLRHGVLIQNFAHNNLVEKNEFYDNIHDAIDLHGQGEYLNEIKGNIIEGVIRGGIGVGNTGGTPPNSHSASGAGNLIHYNKLTNTRDGITVIMGSPETIIEKNIIKNTQNPANSKGIYLLNAPRTVVKDNIIVNNHAHNFWGILVAEDHGDRNNDNKGAGIPEDILISGNKLINNSNGIRLEAGRNIVLENNTIKKSLGDDFVNLIPED
ncbi:right-handed parallel beta-helix repeat-containing protein [Caldalkalibacillus horti]|uniref:Parallel beta-helix repeat protein n=1 Tax=Caldalkalibacillus horti TaxID=77523 RepID=A0ABT9VW51_9BACI|nr:right-handed parallel beta-helix repeat-containing protein [Bacillus horti]MDQ0165206.1 parallel beta-helix repeat protein [Bacillus horti]